MAETNLENVDSNADCVLCGLCDLSGVDSGVQIGCALVDALTVNKSHNSRRMAAALLRQPEGQKIHRYDVLGDSEFSDLDESAYPAFGRVASEICDSPLNAGMLRSGGKRGGKYYLIDREKLLSACANLPEQDRQPFIEAAQEQLETFEWLKEHFGRKPHISVIVSDLVSGRGDYERIYKSETVTKSRILFDSYRGSIDVTVQVDSSSSDGHERTVVRVPSHVREMILTHATEVRTSEAIEPSCELTPEGLLVESAIHDYVNGGRVLPCITACPLSDLAKIRTSLGGDKATALDGRSVSEARSGQIARMIDKLFSFWYTGSAKSIAHSVGTASLNRLANAIGMAPDLGGANCLGVDPDLFYPERGASTREAKEVCRGCVVREDCLEFALSTKERHGIWGGLSERERRRIRRQRAQARRAAEAEAAESTVAD